MRSKKSLAMIEKLKDAKEQSVLFESDIFLNTPWN